MKLLYNCFEHQYRSNDADCPECILQKIITLPVSPSKPTSERPKIQDVFPEGTTLNDVLKSYTDNEYLFKYAQALDHYIDELEQLSTPPQLREGEVEDRKRNNETLYTYYQIDLQNISVEWDCTICESLEQVLEVLKSLDIHLDDDTPVEPGFERKVVIQGIGMTPLAYEEFKKEAGL
jgi:hypothetical protein